MSGHSDFNGDGRDDLLFWAWNGSWNSDFEHLGLSDGGFAYNTAGSGVYDARWTLLGTGDFNGDGRDDVLVRYRDYGQPTDLIEQALSNADGMIGEYPADRSAAYPLPAGWQVAGIGDFNGDGCDDLLLRNESNIVTEWLGHRDASFFSNHGIATYVLPAGWHIIQTGDFNGDSRADVLLENDDRIVTEWLGRPDGTFFSNHALATYVLPAGWHVAGTGDFNGDKHSDVILVNDDGTTTEWLGRPDGTFDWNAPATYVLPSGWHVKSTGDYNGDGFDDVLLAHDNGTVTDWLGQPGGTFFSNHEVAWIPGMPWTMLVNDFGGLV